MRTDLLVALGALGVVAVGGVAYAATRPASTTGSAPAGGGASPPAQLPAGSPQGLVSSGPTADGWGMTIALQPNTSGLSYEGFFADVVTVTLPAGAHWRAITQAGNAPATGPQSGIDPFVFSLVEPMTYTFAYTDASGVNQGTTISFALGGTFQATTRLNRGDYVILAFAASDLVAVLASIQQAMTVPAGTPLAQQEAATLAIANQLVGGTPTPAEALTWIVSLGPWAQSFSPDVRALVAMPQGTALPAWWPTDDTGAASEYHVIYRYTGPGIDVAALPVPCKAWRRIA
jgi:hypothetical protein